MLDTVEQAAGGFLADSPQSAVVPHFACEWVSDVPTFAVELRARVSALVEVGVASLKLRRVMMAG